MTNDKTVSAQRLSTDAFPDRMRLAAWRAFVAQSAGACDAVPLNDQPFRVDSRFFGLPDVGIMFTQRSDSVIQCYRMMSDPGAGVETVSLSVTTRGRMSVVQGGREVSAGATDGLVFSAPGRVEARDGFETTFINLPVASVRAAIPDFDPRLPAVIPGETGAMRQLALYARVVKEGPDSLSGALARSMADHFFDLAILALGVRGGAREAARRRSR